MALKNLKYLFLLVLTSAFISCRQSKYVADDYYLLKDNDIHFQTSVDSTDGWEGTHDQIDEDELQDLIKPETNNGLRLWVYNRIDSARYNKKIVKKRKKFKKKNLKRKAKEDKINQKRINKAKKKGKTHYKQKVKREKKVRLGWRHWVIENWGEAPVLLDTSKISKSKQQMEVYLSQRGFKYAEISDSIVYNEKKQKAWVNYYIKPGRPYVINSISFDSAGRNTSLMKLYSKMVRKEGTDIKVGNLVDEDDFDDERDHFTKYLKDHAYFGFTKNYISFVVDTTLGDYKADVVIYIKEKEVPDPTNPDTTTVLPHMSYLVDDIYYKLHNPDSLSFKDWAGYKKKAEENGYSYPYLDDNDQYYLLDTTFIQDTIINKYFINLDKNRRKKYNVGLFGKVIDTVVSYKGYYIYNEQPFLQPILLNKQNFLEHTFVEREDYHYAKDYYIHRSNRSMLRLDVFSKVSPTVVIDPDRPLGNFVDVTYDLTPAPKQQFTIEPRATNTASILGVSGKITYTNKNLYRAGHQLTVSVEGGFQSQPLVTGNPEDSTKRFRFTGLNTFEIGPEIKYKIPTFWPLTRKMKENLSNRAFPSTEIAALYNFQLRPEFSRHLAELDYRWKFSIPPDEIQRVTLTPLIINFVKLNKQSSFDSTLNATNDPFLINSYSDFFSIGIMNFKHELTNAAVPKSKKNQKFLENSYSNTFDISAAGLMVNTIYSLFEGPGNFVDSFNLAQKKIFGVDFAQYMKFTNTFIYNMYVNPKHRVATRVIIGAGFTYGNGFSLPYAQSYVAGGSNDIRAFSARTMAPGGYQAWDDPDATETQIGDMKLEWNLEWRFVMNGNWNGALFTDVGNIWKINSSDPNDPGLFQFSEFYKQAAIGFGFGVRYDLTFLIARVDLSWPLYNPYLDAGDRWWLRGDKTEFIDAQKAKLGDGFGYFDLPHAMRFNFGIGYPF